MRARTLWDDGYRVVEFRRSPSSRRRLKGQPRGILALEPTPPEAHHRGRQRKVAVWREATIARVPDASEKWVSGRKPRSRASRKEFAQKLDKREDIKLFVKLPGWFVIDTPVGKYNPDWAILEHDDQMLYLVRETTSTRDFLKLGTSEAHEVRCVQKHCQTLGVPFSFVVSADEV